MSKMNLSELYEDVQKNFKPKSQDHIAKGIELDRIRENMQHLVGKNPKLSQDKIQDKIKSVSKSDVTQESKSL